MAVDANPDTPATTIALTPGIAAKDPPIAPPKTLPAKLAQDHENSPVSTYDTNSLAAYDTPPASAPINALIPNPIKNEVIAKYAGSAAVECFGVVGMASYNVKDGLVKLLKKDNIAHGVNVVFEEDKLTIALHIIVAYGVSIQAVADNLMSNVKYKVEEYTGMTVNKIRIIVEGVRITD